MTESTPDADFMSRQEVAEYLGVSPRTIEAWAERGQGPRYTKMNNKLTRYRRTDVDAWLADQPTAP